MGMSCPVDGTWDDASHAFVNWKDCPITVRKPWCEVCGKSTSVVCRCRKRWFVCSHCHSNKCGLLAPENPEAEVGKITWLKA